MKICFLDFDGVLKPLLFHGNPGDFSKSACTRVQELLLKVPDLRIVVSSSWRVYGLDAVRDILKSNGIDPIKVIDITGGPKEHKGQNHAREHHIEEWLREHPEIDNFVILDDEAEIDHMKEKYVHTNAYVGLTQRDMEKAIEILQSESRLH